MAHNTGKKVPVENEGELEKNKILPRSGTRSLKRKANSFETCSCIVEEKHSVLKKGSGSPWNQPGLRENYKSGLGLDSLDSLGESRASGSEPGTPGSRKSDIPSLGLLDLEKPAPMSEMPSRPFKLWSCDRAVKKSIMASSLKDVVKRGGAKLDFDEPPRVVLEEDGTEVDEEDYFANLPYNSTLMLLRKEERWSPEGQDNVAVLGVDETDHGDGRKGLDTAQLARNLRKDLAQVITFSNKQLQQLVDCDTPTLARHLGESERFAESVQDACQQHLDEREETTEAIGLLKLFKRSLTSRNASAPEDG